MDASITAATPAEVEADLLALVVTEDAPPAGLPDELTRRLGRLAGSGDLRADRGAVLLVHLDGELRAPRLAVAGAGPAAELDADALRTAAAAVAREAGQFGGTVAWRVDPSLHLAPLEQVRALVEGTAFGAYDPARWKSEDGDRRPIERVVLVGAPEEADAQRFARVCEWASRARDLANMPPNLLTPAALAAEAERVAAGSEHLRVEALTPEEMRRLGMGAFLAVAGGSANEGRMIVLRHDPPGARGDVLVGLVGKALTFDAGGISLKPALRMQEMKGDMCGGGAVIAGLGAVAELEIPLRTIGVVAAAENLPSGTSFRPGDILTAMNGKTIEITNTDAEGRLVLADALWYAREQGATHLVDFATLTGAMVLALGDLYAGFFANDEAWAAAIQAAADTSGDRAWRFPLHPRYRRYVDSTFADMKNSSEFREGAPALAAEFLHEFAGEGPWAHVDMAGTAFLSRSRGDYLCCPGGTGYGVRLIVELAQNLA